MKVKLEPGRYIVAVSGGVDSMVLLDMIKKAPSVQLVVAHYDHGIREDSGDDRRFVQEVAERLDLPFQYWEGKLGPHASEAVARQARYKFLHRVREAHHANAILTAHHEDDLLETAILNIIRGTGRKGLTALGTQRLVIRPLLHITKKDILEYAQAQKLDWHEDSTNTDEKYRRNYIRNHLLSKFDINARTALVDIIERSRANNAKLDILLADMMQRQPDIHQLDRRWFAQLPHKVAKEFLATWLREHGIKDFDSKTLERVAVAAKVQHTGALIDLVGGASLEVKKDHLALVRPER